MSRPSISVVVPAYNAEQYVAETLEAILSQTRPPEEVIVVDDGSTDGTPDQLIRFRGDVQAIRQTNRGAAGAHNTGFGIARGDYVARCDADDVWEPTKLEHQAEALRTHPEIDVAFTGARVFGEFERPFVEFAGGAAPPSGVIIDHRSFARSLYRANMICASSVLIRLSLQRRLGPFAQGLPNEDYDYWLRAAKGRAVFFHDPTVLVLYRRHPGSVTRNVIAMYEAAQLVHARHGDLVNSPALVRKALAYDRFMIARAFLEEGSLREARQALRSSILHWPTPQTLGWAAVLAAPARYRGTLAEGLGSLKRAFPVATQ